MLDHAEVNHETIRDRGCHDGGNGSIAQPVQTDWGDWYYLETSTALETAEWLILYGETDLGVTWILTRRCDTGMPMLQSKVQNQGEALDLDHAYYKPNVIRSYAGRVQTAARVVAAWLYDTRVRVDSLPIRKVIWRYGWDSDGGWEQLWLAVDFYSKIG